MAMPMPVPMPMPRFPNGPRVVDLSFSHFLCKNLNEVCADYLIIFRDLLRFFVATFFQKQASRDHLTQGNLLKTTSLNEKQSNLGKEMYGNISLNSQYFHLRQEVMFTKHTSAS